MATRDDVRRIAQALPGTVENLEHFSFSVEVKGKLKGYAWVWNERIEPKKPRVPNPEVLAIMVPSLSIKEILNDPAKFVQDPHYNGFPAVLARLAAIDVEELTDLLTEAWRCKAPKPLLKELDASRSSH